MHAWLTAVGRQVRVLVVGLLAIVAGVCGCAGTRQADVVIYGASAGGVVAAVAAAREGASVILLEPGRHIGGMVTGGLGATDKGREAVIGGMSRAFFVELGEHYNEPISWFFEPHVATQVFERWLDEAGVEVLFEHRLGGLSRGGGEIHAIRMLNGASFAAKVYMDCSYEGDLMAMAGVSYTWGREGQDQYGESLAGVREYSKYHQFDVPVPAHDEEGRLLPCVHPGERGEPGQSDRKVQAYNFRVCLCNRKDNQVPFPKPADYDPRRYELLKRYLQKKGDDIELRRDLMIISMMPNGKTDVNNRGAFSTDHIGGNWDYPETDCRRRQEIWDDHVSYVQGFFYFLANDPSVPERIRREMSEWGLAKDEFVDTGHWPHQLYVREARRMVGEWVMTQKDLQTERTKPDSIGMGSYNSDSHHVQRFIRPDGTVENEGDMQVPVQPYEISYRALTPRREECRNLLVPVCFSASHVAYSSMRMEPQYMIMGQAAGLAAVQAIRTGRSVQEIDVSSLQAKLREQGQVLTLGHAAAPHIRPADLGGVVVDNDSARVVGDWRGSTAMGPFVGLSYLHDENSDKAGKSVRFVPHLPAAGKYEVLIAYTTSSNRASNVPVTIQTTDGPVTVRVNQRQAPGKPPFASLGVFSLPAGEAGYVEVTAEGTDGHVIADAVQWLPK